MVSFIWLDRLKDVHLQLNLAEGKAEQLLQSQIDCIFCRWKQTSGARKLFVLSLSTSTPCPIHQQVFFNIYL
jgi:hypothetical protein